jgi:hypothetical protein
MQRQDHDADDLDLSAEEVLQLLKFVHKEQPIVVGGQAVSLWAQLFRPHYPSAFEGVGPVTSRDIDFYHDRDAERSLASQLDDGSITIPQGDTHSPSAAVVSGKILGRPVVVDFLNHVKGVDDKSLVKNSLQIEHGSGFQITIMHPLDNVASRFSNINMLKRTEDHSVMQAMASVAILDCFIDTQLNDTTSKLSSRIALDSLRGLEFIIKEKHIGKISQSHFGDALRPLDILEKYSTDERLDERVREKLIMPIIQRLAELQAVSDIRRNMKARLGGTGLPNADGVESAISADEAENGGPAPR